MYSIARSFVMFLTLHNEALCEIPDVRRLCYYTVDSNMFASPLYYRCLHMFDTREGEV